MKLQPPQALSMDAGESRAPREQDITQIGSAPDFYTDDFYLYAESRGHEPHCLQTPVDDSWTINFIANVIFSLPFAFLLVLLLLKLWGGQR